ncbi:uridine kinase [Gracilibacillus kekensis]|uniref:Uridine kinase n=1 Tax=Gracilibacillus kekensis TaxID=1027249 RepID=A0A1M7P141_9BACI|nr:uridine kinase [Gracilibacillus kekensis]SHN10096.1 uridine kinase [Gracilibacillus kekensis]
MSKKKPIIIGVAGGSGSGKTSVTKAIQNRFVNQSVLVIEQDYYYKDQSEIPMEERLQTNYDHPLAFDNDLLIDHIQQLLDHQTVDKPVYDYTKHTRSDQVIPIEPKDVIIIEGILILDDPRLMELMDIKVFVDTDADLRIIRRLLRDINERSRSIDSVINQYIQTVRPAHLQFIEPSKRYADVIIPEGGQNMVAIDLLATKIEKVLERE